MLELILGFFAWRKGWGAKAFAPVGVSFAIGILLALMGGSDLLELAFLVDVICCVWAGYMAFRPPQKVAAVSYTAAGTPHGSDGYTYMPLDTAHSYGSHPSGEATYNGSYNE